MSNIKCRGTTLQGLRMMFYGVTLPSHSILTSEKLLDMLKNSSSKLLLVHLVGNIRNAEQVEVEHMCGFEAGGEGRRSNSLTLESESERL